MLCAGGWLCTGDSLCSAMMLLLLVLQICSSSVYCVGLLRTLLALPALISPAHSLAHSFSVSLTARHRGRGGVGEAQRQGVVLLLLPPV
ncbi:hypothetical protein FKM82_015597 [Ascaphus truei]